MYIFKNAWRNITRNKGRNILIGIIVIVIAAACSITLAIRESASDIVEAYQEKNKIEATIGMNRNALMDSLKKSDDDEEQSQEDMINTFNDIESVTLDEIKDYGDSKYVTSYYYTYSLSMDADDIDEATDSLVKETTETTTNTTTKQIPSGGQGGPMGGGGYSTTHETTKKTTEKIFNEKAQDGAFTLIGYDSYESMSKFISGDYTITDGEVSSDFNSNDIVISEELASLNDLEVGDTITLVNPKDDDLTYEATITGIYKENTDSSSDMSSMFSNSANEIITNINFIQTILAADDDLSATITPTFIIKDADSVEAFSEEVSEKGLSEYYTVTSNLDEIESATESVDNVKVFATTFLIITLIIGGVVLVVINMINIRERKYEIGVLRTIGMKKSKLSLQFMFELLIVSIVSLMIGAGIGACLSVPVSNKLLSNEIANSTSEYDNIGSNFGMGGQAPDKTSDESTTSDSTDEDSKETTTEATDDSTTTDDSNTATTKDKKQDVDFKNMNMGVANVSAVSSIDAVVDFKVLAELLGIGVALTLLSSLASMIAIARFSPLTILKERS